jgi:Amt family ammonium transporter
MKMSTPVLSGADAAWILAATALVQFMTLPGPAIFYSSLVCGKNALSILVQCCAITSVVMWLLLKVLDLAQHGERSYSH